MRRRGWRDPRRLKGNEKNVSQGSRDENLSDGWLWGVLRGESRGGGWVRVEASKIEDEQEIKEKRDGVG